MEDEVVIMLQKLKNMVGNFFAKIGTAIAVVFELIISVLD